MIQRPVVELVAGLKVEELFIGADGLQQLDDVVGVERAGLRGHAAGQIRVADVRHASMDVQLSGFGGLDVSSGLRRQIHHHRPVSHALHHLTLDQHRSALSWTHTTDQTRVHEELFKAEVSNSTQLCRV